MSRDNRPPHRTFSRLTLEQLECRVNPADFYWTPGSGNSAGVAANWMTGPGIPYALWNRLPGPQDDLYFQGDVSTADCVIPAQPAPTNPSYPYAFHGVHLLFEPLLAAGGGTIGMPGFPSSPPSPPPPPRAYTGTVTIQDSMAVGTLEVDCGTIRQADPNAPTGTAGPLTVMTSLDWTGGTLNNNTVAGTIALAPGATGVAAPSFTNPGINGTVYLGSTLELQGIPEGTGPDPTPSVGSTLTMTDGTYELNGGDFHAMDGSQLIMAPVPKANNSGTPDISINNKKWTKPVVEVEAGATAKVTSVGRVNNVVPVKVKIKGSDPDDPGIGVAVHNSGTVVIDSYALLIVEKQTGAKFAEYLQIKAPNKPAPITWLQAGSGIIFESKGNPATGCVEIKDGTLQLYGRPELTDAQQPDAVIQAPAKDPEDQNPVIPALFVGKDAKVNFLSLGAVNPYVKLKITGDFTCVGEMYLRADRSGTDNDKITATGFMKYQIGQDAAKLNVSWRNPGAGLPVVDTEWALLTSDGGIVTDPTVGTIPTDVSQPSTLTAERLMAPSQFGLKFKK